MGGGGGYNVTVVVTGAETRASTRGAASPAAA